MVTDALAVLQITLPGRTASSNVGVRVTPTSAHKCPRCWRFVAPAPDAVCGRCQTVLRDDGHT